MNANIHVKKLLSTFASDLGGADEAAPSSAESGDGKGSKRSSTVTLGTVAAIHRVMQKMEITVKVCEQSCCCCCFLSMS